MFVDKTKITVQGGKGGSGIVSFRQAKYEPKGGPDGGNGGDGGDVYLTADKQPADLVNFAGKNKFKAEDGADGEKNERRGAGGEDLFLKMPVGTTVYEPKIKRSFDLNKNGKKMLIAKGGRGGRGNASFKSSTNQTPKRADKGSKGEKRNLVLKLRLIANVGLIGKPNAGKSTLLSTITRAKPEIADYPFTTTVPNLGVLEHKGERLVIADIPGLIKDAHKGKGLGDRFLQHIERCEKIVHVIDGSEENIVSLYNMIRNELKRYHRELTAKEELVVLNKVDVLDNEEVGKKREKLKENTKKEVYSISAVTKEGIEEFLDELI